MEVNAYIYLVARGQPTAFVSHVYVQVSLRERYKV